MADYDESIELLKNDESNSDIEERIDNIQTLKKTRRNLDLTDNRDYHLFVCYNQENSADRVRIIVRNLEQLGFKCCYHERDFVAGHNILGNVNAAIDRSVGILVVLCQDFVNSRYCLHEVEQALHVKIAQGYTVIPIMIEPCIIPESLKYISYIDARSLDVNQMHLKISDAFLNNEYYSEHDAQNSGLAKAFSLTPYNIWYKWGSVVRYKLTISHEEREDLWSDGFEVTDEDLQEVECIINSSVLVKLKHIFNLYNRITTFVFGLLIAVIWLLLSFSDFLVLGTDKRTQDWSSLHDAAVMLSVLIFYIWFICIAADGFGCGCNCKRWKGMTYNLRENLRLRLAETMWNRVNSSSITKRKFIAVYGNDKLVLLKINVKPCMDLFVRSCDRNKALVKLKRRGETNEVYMRRQFAKFVRFNYHLLLQKSTTPPKHYMANGAKCLCQLVEECLLDSRDCVIGCEDV